MKKRDVDDIIVGLHRLSAAITVFGTYASWHKCESDEAVISKAYMNSAYDALADYAEMLGEQLSAIQYPEVETVEQ